jgi:hypothetical protein
VEAEAHELVLYICCNGVGIAQTTDADSVCEWAEKAVCWAAKNELYVLREDETLAPKENATRAEAAAMIHRFAIMKNSEAK